MPESIPSSLIIDTFKDLFTQERGNQRHDPLGWILSVPDTHQKTVLAALDKERALRVLTCATEDEANGVAAGLWIGGEPVIVTDVLTDPLWASSTPRSTRCAASRWTARCPSAT